MSSHSSPHPQEVLLARSSLYVHKCGLKPPSFNLYRKEKSYFQFICSIKMTVVKLNAKSMDQRTGVSIGGVGTV